MKILVRLLTLSQRVILWGQCWTMERPMFGPAPLRELPTKLLVLLFAVPAGFWVFLINRRASQE